ncbi:MAG: TIGR00268 family protein [Planctomycetaceae bacterium]|nr:TIGR00268 family protein [Planctomycetaceae bacterium]
MTSDTLTIESKEQQLLAILTAYGRVAVAFSAGVDSTVVAKAAQIACGDDSVAITANSPSLATGELEAAVSLAKQIGIRHQIIETEEFETESYTQNASDRCFHCKTELYDQIDAIRPSLNVDVVVNGANVDDQGDYRPGMQAARNHEVRSPLIEAGINKADVRELARRWNLPIWDKPASPCLSSRIAYGVEVTPERVARIDQAEAYLKTEFGIRELRVRHEANNLARIEVPTAYLSKLAESAAAISRRLKELGFQYVTIDLEGFRSGSMNEVITLELPDLS